MKLPNCRPCCGRDAVGVHEPLKPRSLLSDEPEPDSGPALRSSGPTNKRRRRARATGASTPVWQPSLGAINEDGLNVAKDAAQSRECAARTAKLKQGSTRRLLQADVGDGYRHYEVSTVASAFFLAPTTYFL